MYRMLTLAACVALVAACAPRAEVSKDASNYLDYAGRNDLLSGGVTMIPIKTPKGEFRVWTKRVAPT